ncbi:hypothetical protein A2W14_02295 [Candidatus Gottesmanbacteria bacterium RBG_16_37_8]|uniref:Uncharacterized protein n=1 Tax=Candidatus Gottesmanbacteria bacterium RBG_16_37_8 TaxID=1798371 RepID=A0A1F5YRI8_9BACT|nr:MAG: hypothetical protein A2W14_02295 [Candidatus Gottesmanbacteria bacterium RBG_16_37_8]
MITKKIPYTKKEKKLQLLKIRLSFYEGKLFRHISDYQGDITESISSKVTKQEVIMLNVAIDDLRQEIDELES